jgi:hypothetical protein
VRRISHWTLTVFYKVSSGGEVVITYSGISLDDVEDRLLNSGTWASVAPMLVPNAR